MWGARTRMPGPRVGVAQNNSHMNSDENARDHTRDLAAALVRGFAAVDELLQAQYENDLWATPDRVAERLEAAIAARLELMAHAYGGEDMNDVSVLLDEAADNLGRGEHLDPWDVLAFRAPVDFRSHRVVLTDPPALSADVTAVQSQLP